LKRPIRAALTALTLAAGVVACSSGTVTTVSPTGPNVNVLGAGSVTVGSQGATQQLPGVGTVNSAIVTFPAPSSGSGATIAYIASATAPTGVPALDEARRGSEDAVRSPQSTTNTALWFLTIAASQTISFASTPPIAVTLASIDPRATYYLALFDPTSGASGAWTEPWGPAGSVSGTTVSFVAVAATLTLKANVSYTIAVYASVSGPTPSQTPSPTPSQTPSPSPTPTASPTPTVSPTTPPTSTPSPTPSPAPLTANPTALGLTQVGAASFSVTEAGYRGSYTVASDDTSRVTVTTPIASSSDTTTIAITVPSTAQGGTANVTVSDSHGQSVRVPVTVTLTNVTVQGAHHR
jgi:hypothetical protein